LRSPTRASYYQEESPKATDFVPTLPLSGQIPSISPSTLADILNGVYDEHFDNLYILDCRYEYEFKGGHIKNATNFSSINDLFDEFFDCPVPDSLIVFHCEFSHNRGPQLAGLFRELDRNLNKLYYPRLHYPHVYILDGGYRQFYTEFPEQCEGGYVRMLDEQHRTNGDLTKETTLFRKKIEEFEQHTRKPLATINKQGKRELLKSPVAVSMASGSPIVSRALNFVSSPITPRRI
jgi:M-phase inducer tyrosine phosphatase